MLRVIPFNDGPDLVCHFLICIFSFSHSGTISRDSDNKQVLDKLQVERERGITVKAQTASLFYNDHEGETYLLNLIDTPVSVNQLWCYFWPLDYFIFRQRVSAQCKWEFLKVCVKITVLSSIGKSRNRLRGQVYAHCYRKQQSLR